MEILHGNPSGWRVAHNFLRGDNEPGHGGNRLAVVYAKQQPAKSDRACVHAPASLSCTRITLVHLLDRRLRASTGRVHRLPDTCFGKLAMRP